MPRATAEPEPINDPNWEQFILQMFSDEAYQRVTTATTMAQSVSRIESFFAVQGEAWDLAALLWQGMITGCPKEQRPTDAEADKWQQIADAANMPISFRGGMLRHVIGGNP